MYTTTSNIFHQMSDDVGICEEWLCEECRKSPIGIARPSFTDGDYSDEYEFSVMQHCNDYYAMLASSCQVGFPFVLVFEKVQ